MKRLFVALLIAFPLIAQEHGTTFALADGTKIYYETTGGGSGTPLVVVNGGPGFDHMYLHTSNVWDTLAKNRTIVMYDQRGNGRSDALKANQSCTLADQINDLDALRDHLGYKQIDLLGHSWGGYLVMAYTARHPIASGVSSSVTRRRRSGATRCSSSNRSSPRERRATLRTISPTSSATPTRTRRASTNI